MVSLLMKLQLYIWWTMEKVVDCIVREREEMMTEGNDSSVYSSKSYLDRDKDLQT